MIFLSAGHYPERPGACYKEFCEHGEAVNWVNEIAGVMDTGCLIVPTGTLKNKVGYINDLSKGGDICVEIHFNAAMVDGVHVGRGSECLYMPRSLSGKALAEIIQTAIVSTGDFRDRGVKEGWYRMNPNNGADYFLSKTKCPAVIIEPDFIHRKDSILEQREDACTRIAEALIKKQAK